MVVSVAFCPGSEVDEYIMLMLVAESDIVVGLDSNGALIMVVVASIDKYVVQPSPLSHNNLTIVTYLLNF